MSTQIANYSDAIEQLPAGSTVVFSGVSWAEYEEVLESVGEANRLRISYDEGTMRIMTISGTHEGFKMLIHDLVRATSLRFRIKVLSFGSATMRKPAKLKGVESDLSYYVETADQIGSRSDLDFSVDPSPDIIVEVDLQHQSLSKFPIYAALGVKEIWRYDGHSMCIYALRDGVYLEVSSSRSLRALTTTTLTEFLARLDHEDQYEIVLAFEEWLSTQQT